MKASGWALAIAAPVALAGGVPLSLESCGAMNFELPPEEPAADSPAPPRLVRPEGGVDKPQSAEEARP